MTPEDERLLRRVAEEMNKNYESPKK